VIVIHPPAIRNISQFTNTQEQLSIEQFISEPAEVRSSSSTGQVNELLEAMRYDDLERMILLTGTGGLWGTINSLNLSGAKSKKPLGLAGPFFRPEMRGARDHRLFVNSRGSETRCLVFLGR
jgi:hypothetical protein